MNRDNLMYGTPSNGMISPFSSSGNSLGIIFSYSSWDLIRSQMTLLIQSSLENEISVVGASEVELKPGYQYSILSCRLVKPRQIQVIFEFRSHISGKHN